MSENSHNPYAAEMNGSSNNLLPTAAARNSMYLQGNTSTSSMAEKFALAPDPASWGIGDISGTIPEDDDALHNPSPARDLKFDNDHNIFTARGFANIGCLALMVLCITTLFAGFPIITHFMKVEPSTQGGFNLGGTNGTGQVPVLPGNFGLVDLDTPKEAWKFPSYSDGSDWQLIFSDEFNKDGRTFYPGDDPYWEAVDLHYWSTGNEEWYDPGQITTKNGSLRITLSRVENPSPDVNHGLNYTGGMMSTWNKFCFTGGIIQASVKLPGPNNVQGLWPAVWTMGNLGRAGYGATTDGTWPYSYDSCDVGTLRNQTYPGFTTPTAALTTGDPNLNGQLSELPGQRLSRCTCPGESHPGPVHADGTYVGRSAPEIDIFEAQMEGRTGEKFGAVSQSGQWAPFNAAWKYNNATTTIFNATISKANGYNGSPYQQATSVVTTTNQGCYEVGDAQCFSIYAFEYKPGFDDAYITWISDGVPVWSMKQISVGPDAATEIGSRPIPQEPMYILANLGQSLAFTNPIEYDLIPYPVTMEVDWIRVYQDPKAINYGCNPPDFPTEDYINTYIEAYTNPNLTVWGQKEGVDQGPYNQVTPKNSLIDKC